MAERAQRRREAAVLRVRGLHVYYGQSHALQGVELDLPHGVVSVVGRNGMGKTTLCNAITGLVPVASGSIQFEGDELTGLGPSRIAHYGVGYVPQGRRLWTSLTVDEHLRLCARGTRGGWTRERVYDAFPRLALRRTSRAGQLSGGEQQMLAISRALLLNPRLLVMDEPTEGLAPVIVQQVEDMLIRIGEEGEISVLVIEQNIGVATAVSDDVAIMVNGRIHRVMDAAALAGDRELQQRLLGVGRHGGEGTPDQEDPEVPGDSGTTPDTRAPEIRLVWGHGAGRVWMSNPAPPTRWSAPVPVAGYEAAAAALAGPRRARAADGDALRPPLARGRARRPRDRHLRHQGCRAQVHPRPDRGCRAAGEAGRCLHLGPAVGGGRASPPDRRLPPERSERRVHERPRIVGARDGGCTRTLDAAPAGGRGRDLRRRLRRRRAGRPRDADPAGRSAEGHDLDRRVGRREPVRRPVGHHDAVLGDGRAGSPLDRAQGARERGARPRRNGGEPWRRDLGPRPRAGADGPARAPGDRPHDVRRDHTMRAAGECEARGPLRLPRLPRDRDRRAFDGEAARLRAISPGCSTSPPPRSAT